jgi:hypothetical protein
VNIFLAIPSEETIATTGEAIDLEHNLFACLADRARMSLFHQ